MPPRVNVNGIAAGACGAGLILMWSGIKGTSVLAAVQNVIQGKAPPTEQMYPIDTPTGSSGAASDTAGTTLAKGGTATQNQATAKLIAAKYGWSDGAEWSALVKLWQNESGWSNTADNPSSHAYGIPQALPASKMPQPARPPSKGGTSDAGAQISWGLDYIKTRYGSPSKALAAWNSRSPHWY